MNLGRRICSSLYADDGAIWIRGRDNASVLKKIKEAILKVEQWSYNWGFKISTSKSCYMYLTRKKNRISFCMDNQWKKLRNLNIWECGLMRDVHGRYMLKN